MSCNNVQILNFNHNIVEVGSDNKLIITDNVKCNSITIPQPVTNILQINSPGPQGPAGASVNTGSFVTTSSFNAFTSSINQATQSLSSSISSLSSSFISFSGSYNTGSFSGSFTGSLEGTSSWAYSSSVAISSSFATTASYAINAGTTIDTGSFVTTSSFNAFTSSFNTFTGSYNTGSFTGSFIGNLTGSLQGTASWANSASIAISSSFATTASYAMNAGTTVDTSSFVTTSSFNTFTSSYNTGSFSGSFTGSLFGTATTASYVTASAIVGTVLSASYAQTASYVVTALTASYVTSSNIVGTVLSASYAQTSSYVVTALTASYVTSSNIVGTVLSASYSITSSYATVAANGGVTKILAGANVNISPVNGLGDVTVTSFGTNLYNTATGSYGSFYDTGSVTATSATAIYSMSLNTTDISNGVFISASNEDNTKIKFTNAGTYNLQFSSQFSNTDNSNQDVVIWVKKNGVDIPDSSGVVSVPPFKAGSNGQVISGWNYFLNLSANDYVQMCWHVEQANVITLETIAAGTSPTHPRTPSTILTAQRVDTFLSNTGSFSGSFTGDLLGTATTASYAVTASFALTSAGGSGGISQGKVVAIATGNSNLF